MWTVKWSQPSFGMISQGTLETVICFSYQTLMVHSLQWGVTNASPPTTKKPYFCVASNPDMTRLSFRLNRHESKGEFPVWGIWDFQFFHRVLWGFMLEKGPQYPLKGTTKNEAQCHSRCGTMKTPPRSKVIYKH